MKHYSQLFSILFVLSIVKWIINQIHYMPITIISTSAYSKFIEQLCILNKVPYLKLVNPYYREVLYPLATFKKMIALNPQWDDFVDEEVDINPLNQDDLLKLSKHTGLSVSLLSTAQDQVLHLLPQINGYQIVRENYIEDDYIYTDDMLMSIKGHQIQTKTKCYFTRYILSDDIEPVKVGEIVQANYFTDTVVTEKKYIMNHYYVLESLRKKLKDNIIQLPFYSLAEPRPSGLFHPFHLPSVTDPILAIMVLTQIVLNKFKL